MNPLAPQINPISQINRPENAEAIAKLGFQELTASRRASAKIFFDQAIALNPNCRIAHMGLGEYQRLKGDFRAAKEIFENLHNSTSQNLDLFVRSRLGAIHCHLGDSELGASLLREVHSINPHYPFLKAYKKYLVEEPQTLTHFFEKAKIDYINKRFSSAKDNFEKALTFDPKHIDSLLYLGQLFFYKKEINLAIPYFEKVLELDSSNYLANLNISQCYNLKAKLTEALTHVNKSLEIAPNCLIAHRCKIDYLLRIYKHDEAEQELKKTYEIIKPYLNLDIEFDDLYKVNLENLNINFSDFFPINSESTNRLSFQKTNITYYKVLKSIVAAHAQILLFKQRKIDSSYQNPLTGQLIARVLELEKNYHPALMMLAELKLIEGNVLDAKKTYKKILSNMKNYPPAAAGLLLCYELENKHEKINSFLENEYPDNILWGIIDRLVFHKRYKLALDCLEKIKVRDTRFDLLYSKHAASYTIELYHYKRYKEAILVYEHCLALCPLNKDFIYYQLFQLCYFDNNYQKALKYLNQCHLNFHSPLFNYFMQKNQISAKELIFNFFYVKRSLELFLRKPDPDKIWSDFEDDIYKNYNTAALPRQLNTEKIRFHLQVALRKNDLRNAITAIADEERDNPKISGILGIVECLDGNYDQAIVHAKDPKIDPNFSATILGMVALRQNKLVEAELHFKNALELNSFNMYAQIFYAELLRQKNQNLESLALLNSVTRTYGTVPFTYLFRALVYFQNNQLNEAHLDMKKYCEFFENPSEYQNLHYLQLFAAFFILYLHMKKSPEESRQIFFNSKNMIAELVKLCELCPAYVNLIEAIIDSKPYEEAHLTQMLSDLDRPEMDSQYRSILKTILRLRVYKQDDGSAFLQFSRDHLIEYVKYLSPNLGLSDKIVQV